jgi:hypothetical protein
VTLKSSAFRELAAQLLSAEADERDQGCLDFRVMWSEMNPDEKTSLSIVLAHVLADEADEEIREEELHALSEVAGVEDLAPGVITIVGLRGAEGLNPSEQISWQHVMESGPPGR